MQIVAVRKLVDPNAYIPLIWGTVSQSFSRLVIQNLKFIYSIKVDVEKMYPTLMRSHRRKSTIHIMKFPLISDSTLFTATRASAHNNDAIVSRTLNGVIVRTKHQDKYWLNGEFFD